MSQNKFDHLASEPPQANPLPGMEVVAETEPKPGPPEGGTPRPKRKRRTAVEQALELAQEKKDSWKDRLVGVLFIVLMTLLIAGAIKKLVEPEPAAPDPAGRVLVEEDQHLRTMLENKEEMVRVLRDQVKMAQRLAEDVKADAERLVARGAELPVCPKCGWRHSPISPIIEGGK